jgi:hypothetical protein
MLLNAFVHGGFVRNIRNDYAREFIPHRKGYRRQNIVSSADFSGSKLAGISGYSHLLLKHKRNFHHYPVFADLATRNNDPLVLDPCPGHIAERIGGAGNALLAGILKAFFALCDDFDDFGDGHGTSLDERGWNSMLNQVAGQAWRNLAKV